jgi:hypothetical protein
VNNAADERSVLRRVTEPIAHLKEILKADPIFARYEAAFMTYGIGWMICYALVPILSTKKLGLDYESIAESTHAAYWFAVTAMILPAGWLMDRMGAVRTTGLSFFLLMFYPIALMWADGKEMLLMASVWYGIAHAGTSMGWMLGSGVAGAEPGEGAAVCGDPCNAGGDSREDLPVRGRGVVLADGRVYRVAGDCVRGAVWAGGGGGIVERVADAGRWIG